MQLISCHFFDKLKGSFNAPADTMTYRLSSWLLFLLLAGISLQESYAQGAAVHVSSGDTLAARELLSRAASFRKASKHDSAAHYLQQALAIYERLAAQSPSIYLFQQQIDSYRQLGDNYRQMGQYEPALTALTHARQLAETHLGTRNLRTADILQSLGVVYAKRRETAASRSYFEQALEIRRELLGRNHVEVARSYNSLGNVAMMEGSYEDALAYHRQALEIRLEQLGEDHAQTASSYDNMGLVYRSMGDADQAFGYYRRSLAIKERLGVSGSRLASSFNKMGVVLWKKGDYEQAREYYGKALDIRLNVYGENHPSAADTYTNIGIVYAAEGDYENALDHYRLGLNIRRAVFGEEHPEVAQSYNNIGTVHDALGQFDSARDYFQTALEIKQKLLGDQHPEVAATLNNLGHIHRRQAQHKEALTYYRQALAVRENMLQASVPDLAISFSDIGRTYLEMGDVDAAEPYLSKALPMFRDAWGPHHPRVAETLRLRARLEIEKEQPLAALQTYQEALAVLVPGFDAGNLLNNPGADQSVSATKLLDVLGDKAAALVKFQKHPGHQEHALETYSLAIDLIADLRHRYHLEASKLHLGQRLAPLTAGAVHLATDLFDSSGDPRYLSQALRFSTRGKSAVLLASLRDSRARRFAGIPDSLLVAERRNRLDLAYYATAIEQARHGKEESEQLRDFERRHFRIQRSQEMLVAQIERDYPRYYRLKYQQETTSIADLQAALGPKDLLLDYYLSDEFIHLFALSPATAKYYRLPRSKQFEADIDDCYRSILFGERQRYIASARRLYRELLAPLEADFKDVAHLVVIPHDNLYYVPFEALLTTDVAKGNPQLSNYESLPYLVRDISVSYYYSANFFYDHQQLRKDNTFQTAFSGFAPVFSEQQADLRRLAQLSPAFTTAGQDASATGRLRDSSELGELLFSEMEVETIAAMFSAKNLSTATYLHDAANEAAFKRSARGSRIVHLATHGIMNSSQPRLSHLAFAGAGSEGGAEDDVLYTGETYNVDLDAQLLVLSSCQSGVGRLATGEGLMALTRGFIYAGAQNILASLWKVSDEHTYHLMIALYEEILAGYSFSSALRAAKLTMLEGSQTADPRSWASFVLIGQ